MGSLISVPEEQQPSHRKKRQRSPEVDDDDDDAANNAPKKQRVEEPRSSNYDDLICDLACAHDRMQKQYIIKEKEYYWLRARTAHLEETAEEHEALMNKFEELDELSDRMFVAIECLKVLLKKTK
ncbi:hypothetical protein TCE0_033r09089 [Talaromyces pinophilus]|uniref:Uncharacterized protein n=1 Tax=Talaromyces pinophilus TaxID=128442 RepID=A0A6V8HAE2_TALPI|nr:hypothetical protein TCE0_033r09089 [Talaromyces pinophilus]